MTRNATNGPIPYPAAIHKALTRRGRTAPAPGTVVSLPLCLPTDSRVCPQGAINEPPFTSKHTPVT